MSICPLDCAVPEVRREKLKSHDAIWLPLLLFPYRCRTCGTRFRRVPSSVGSVVVLTVLFVGLYLGSYAVGRSYSEDSVVRKIYWPVDWMIGQVRQATVVQK